MSPDDLILPLPSLGDYLEFHRKRLGLTREALGRRAFLAPRTIQKLERGEQTGLTEASQLSLAHALGLTSDHERRHLDDLTRVHLPRPWLPTHLRSDVTPGERAFLDDLMPRPAAYCNLAWEVVAANDAYETLFPGRVAANNVMLWLFGPQGRKTMLHWDTEVTNVVARMRGMYAHFGNPQVGIQLLAHLQHDPDFARLWLDRRVSFDRSVDEPQYVRTAAGPVTVRMQLQSVPSARDHLHLCIAVVSPHREPEAPPEISGRAIGIG